MSRVGENIKNAREKSGLTAKVLAKKLGVAEKYINEVESGRKVVSESFIERASKVLKTNLNDISMVVTDKDLMEERKIVKEQKNTKSTEKVAEIWTDAFSSVLKAVPIYDYSLTNKKGFRELPVHSNKVEGYHQDKVVYIQVQDNEMSGFRILSGDLAFAHLAKEVSNNGFFLVEYNGKRKIRQIKTLGNSKILLVSNGGSLITETKEVREINIIAKIEKLEINL